MVLNVSITGSDGKLELTQFTVNKFYRQRRAYSENLSYPLVNKSYLILEGKIDLNTDSKETQDALKLAKWSLVAATDDDAYRAVKLTSFIDGQLDEQITYKQVFIISYEETTTEKTGFKTFKLMLAEASEQIK